MRCFGSHVGSDQLRIHRQERYDEQTLKDSPPWKGWMGAGDGQSFHETTENLDSTKGIPANKLIFSSSVFFSVARSWSLFHPPPFWYGTSTWETHNRRGPAQGTSLLPKGPGPCLVPPVHWPPRSDQRHRSDAWWDCSCGVSDTVDGNPANQLRLVVHPIIYRVFYIQGGARFLPSTVVLGPAATWIFVDVSNKKTENAKNCGGSYLTFMCLKMRTQQSLETLFGNYLSAITNCISG